MTAGRRGMGQRDNERNGNRKPVIEGEVGKGGRSQGTKKLSSKE